MKRNKLHNDPNDPLPPHSKAMMSYPLGKPNYPEPEIIDVEDKESIYYYIDLAKGQPGKKLATTVFVFSTVGTGLINFYVKLL